MGFRIRQKVFIVDIKITKGIMDKLDFIKIKKSLLWKRPCQEDENHWHKLEEIFSNHNSNRGVVARLEKDFKKLTVKQTIQ